MPNKNVNILLKLQDKFTAPMRQAGVITKEQEKAMRRTSQSVIGFSRNVREGFLGGVKHVARFGAAVAGVGGALSVAGIKSFLSSSAELAKAQIEAETKLEAALANVESVAAGGADALARAKTELMDTASSLQRVGVIGDEVTLAGMQQLAAYQLSTDQIGVLSKGMTDMLAKQYGLNASQENAVAGAKLIGKAMSGNTTSLERAGVLLTEQEKQILKNGDATQRAAALSQALERSVGGVNEALAGTDQGRLQQFANNWGDMKEQVGKHVLSLKATLASELVDYIPAIQRFAEAGVQKVSQAVGRGVAWAKRHAEDIKAGILKVKDGVATAWGYIRPVLGFAVEHANTLIPAVLGVTAAISSVSIVADIATKVGGLVSLFNKLVPISKLVTGALSIAKVAGLGLVSGFKTLVTAAKGLKAMLSMVNIAALGPVAIGIGAVIAAGVLLYRHWDEIKPKLVALKDKFVTVFNAIRDKVTAVFSKIKSVAMPIIDAIRSALEKVMAFIDKVKTGLGNLGFGGGSSWGANEKGFITKEYKATGTPYWKGGPTYVNEGRRGEIINLPSGTQIIPHDVARGQRSAPVINLTVTVQGNVIGNQTFMEETGAYVARKVLDALEAV